MLSLTSGDFDFRRLRCFQIQFHGVDCQHRILSSCLNLVDASVVRYLEYWAKRFLDAFRDGGNFAYFPMLRVFLTGDGHSAVMGMERYIVLAHIRSLVAYLVAIFGRRRFRTGRKFFATHSPNWRIGQKISPPIRNGRRQVGFRNHHRRSSAAE